MPIDSLTALYLPATWPPASSGQLLLIFDELLYYRPAEKLPAPLHPPAAGELLASYPPVPFGDELSRFFSLLRDMQVHAPEYFQAYLSSSGKGEQEAAESNWRRMASRLRQIEPEQKSGIDELWRARLYLALAEINQESEEEIARGFAETADKEATMLQALLGGEQDDFEELQQLLQPPITPPSPGRSGNLLKAWGMLYLHDVRKDRPWLLATADQEGAMLLRESYEKATNRSPEKILTLPLPKVSLTVDYLGRRDSWRSVAGEILAQINSLLKEAASNGDFSGSGGQSAEGIRKNWAEALAGHWPQAGLDDPGTPTITFFCLADISFPQLFRQICRPKEEPPQSAPCFRHAILAVIGPAGPGDS
jgi:hypothetical protein